MADEKVSVRFVGVKCDIILQISIRKNRRSRTIINPRYTTSTDTPETVVFRGLGKTGVRWSAATCNPKTKRRRMKTMIDIEDRVTVKLNNGEGFKGVVRHRPQDTGDAWTIEETTSDWIAIGVTHNVQTYAEITRHDSDQ